MILTPALPLFPWPTTSSRGIFDFAERQRRLAELEARVSDPHLWDDPRAAGALTQQVARLRGELSGWSTLTRRVEDAAGLAELLRTDDDPDVRRELESEATELEKELARREVDLLFADPHSELPALLSVHAGAGGTDSQDWAEMLLRMFLRWAERADMKVEFIDESAGEEAGIKSATIRVTGDRAFGRLKSERGVHRLVRLSPFDSAHRRHTSFALVEVTPEIEDDEAVEINPDDVRTDVFRSSGAGGQHVNKTSSAVRLTHIPTGVVVTCQNERSQQQNRDVAWRVLRSRLAALQQEAHAEHLAELRGDVVSAEWGNQIRSYVLHPYTMVKDHRTGVEVGNTDGVLGGAIEPFIEGYLRWAATEEGAGKG